MVVNEISFMEVRAEDFAAVADIAAEVFADDHYYAELLSDAKHRKQRLREMYREAIDLCCHNHGNVIVVKKSDEVIGFLMYFNYLKFRRSNLKDFKNVFGVKIEKNTVDLASFKNIHRRVMQMKQEPMYVLAIGVAKRWQNQRIGSQLFDHFLALFKEQPVIGDISGPFFKKICCKTGFDLKPISDSCDLAVRENNIE